VRRATLSTRIVRLDLGEAEFPYEAGQAAMIGVAGQVECVPYSIASAPEESAQFGWLEFLIKVEASGRWGRQFDEIRRGMRIAIRGPYGSFTFPETPRERHFLFVAGGAGIAPIRSMIRHIVLSRLPGRMRLFYSARTPQDFPYLPELRRMARCGQLDLLLTATRDADSSWRGERGRIAATRLASLIDRPDTLCFVCGPSAMVTDIPLMLTQLGIDKHRIRGEEW
jgi:propane monooxygenase reductase subunit